MKIIKFKKIIDQTNSFKTLDQIEHFEDCIIREHINHKMALCFGV